MGSFGLIIYYIDYVKLLFEDKPKVRVKKISPEPTVGLVNGLYANTGGYGGILPIEGMLVPTSKKYERRLPRTTFRQEERILQKEGIECNY